MYHLLEQNPVLLELGRFGAFLGTIEFAGYVVLAGLSLVVVYAWKTAMSGKRPHFSDLQNK